ncbi:competence/damage-inducible protein A [Scatolibacter rhodanostii]|uniref:competence/damage-inducible protein A n=1 Tax=Scatolibacter rhodanostii TaxID=2014781 RepID=UPI000C07D43D|nr:competence/damage-inducible protein A [Scatolibacter rhodanostii]
MNAEIISVGTELLLGQVINTDTAIVARELSALGINLHFSSVVGDNPERLDESIRSALTRCELLILTGGLGPTQDDLTKETAARAAGKKLVLHEESLRRIENYFNEHTVSENQMKQAMLPEGCTVFQNNNGTAPGCAFSDDKGSTIIMLPGPPSELEPMLLDSVVPYLQKEQNAVIVSHNVHIFGKGEAVVSQIVKDLIDGGNPTVAPYAKEGECYLRVTAKATTPEEADLLCQPAIQTIRERLGDFVYADNAESLEELVVKELTRANRKIATAESCTGGLLAKRITDISGSSAVFEMGCVTYSNEVKEKLLGVPHELLAKYGAVSEQVAKAMAEGIVKTSGADIGIGITGIAGPDGGTAEKPVGLVYIALSDGKNTWVSRRNPIGRTKTREWHRHCSASQALDMVRRYLADLPVIVPDYKPLMP